MTFQKETGSMHPRDLGSYEVDGGGAEMQFSVMPPSPMGSCAI